MTKAGLKKLFEQKLGGGGGVKPRIVSSKSVDKSDVRILKNYNKQIR